MMKQKRLLAGLVVMLVVTGLNSPAQTVTYSIYRKIKISFLMRLGTIRHNRLACGREVAAVWDVPPSAALFIGAGGRSIDSGEDYL